jgi:hypothetical protein
MLVWDQTHPAQHLILVVHRQEGDGHGVASQVPAIPVDPGGQMLSARLMLPLAPLDLRQLSNQVRAIGYEDDPQGGLPPMGHVSFFMIDICCRPASHDNDALLSSSGAG